MGSAADARLAAVAQQVAPVALAGEQLLPVAGGLDALVPGLRRGSVVEVGAAGSPGAMSLALSLLAAPSAAGSWVAVVGLPAAGLVAAAEHGAALERCAVVPHPGDEWSTVVASLLDAVDVVLAGLPRRLRMADARRLAARARERGSVLVVLPAEPGARWPERADLRLTAAGARWDGLGAGHGHLRSRRLTVVAAGRAVGGWERRAEVER